MYNASLGGEASLRRWPPNLTQMTCHGKNLDAGQGQDASVGDAACKGRIVQGSYCPKDASSQGRIVQGMHCPGDALSKGCIVQGMHCPRDALSKGCIVSVICLPKVPASMREESFIPAYSM
jgi:hypothetical protein